MTRTLVSIDFETDLTAKGWAQDQCPPGEIFNAPWGRFAKFPVETKQLVSTH